MPLLFLELDYYDHITLIFIANLFRVGKDAMDISYLIGIATRGFNTEFHLQEVR